MNFEYPAEAEAFRVALRIFMEKEIPSWWTYILADDERSFEFTRDFCRKQAAKGWLTIYVKPAAFLTGQRHLPLPPQISASIVKKSEHST